MPPQDCVLMLENHCRRKERPAWQMLLGSRDFGAIMLLNAMMFMTQNGSRAVLMPLLATQAFGVTTTTLGTGSPLLRLTLIWYLSARSRYLYSLLQGLCKEHRTCGAYHAGPAARFAITQVSNAACCMQACCSRPWRW